jgi:hypothetical protein
VDRAACGYWLDLVCLSRSRPLTRVTRRMRPARGLKFCNVGPRPSPQRMQKPRDFSARSVIAFSTLGGTSANNLRVTRPSRSSCRRTGSVARAGCEGFRQCVRRALQSPRQSLVFAQAPRGETRVGLMFPVGDTGPRVAESAPGALRKEVSGQYILYSGREHVALCVFGNLFGLPAESFVVQVAWGSLGMRREGL